MQYPSRNTSSLLHSKSWKIENWRSFVWKTILVSSTTTKDLIETRSRLDQRESSIGFYSWTTASRQNCPTVTRRCSTRNVLPTNPTNIFYRWENYQMHERVSQGSFHWLKGHVTDRRGPERDWRGNKRPRGPAMYGHIYGSICLMQRKRKQNKDGLSRNRSSIRPEERLRSIFVIEPDEEFKRTMKVAHRKLEIPMPAAEALKNSNKQPQRNLPQ